MSSKQKIYYIIIIFTAIVAGLFIFYKWQIANAEIINFSTISTVQSVALTPIERPKAEKKIIKGLYLTAYSAGNPEKIAEIIKLIAETELNAVVIDIKDYSGYILYNTHVVAVNKLNLVQNRIHDIAGLIKKLHDQHIYVIARQTVFQDPALAEKKLEWAIKNKAGGVWHDNKGLSWVDATRREVWNYNLQIAREAINLGFDEINFDYVRFPSDGDMSQVAYSSNRPKYEIMGEFYKFLSTHLAQWPAWISIDMFGYVMERTDDLKIGQRMVDAVAEVDYICPMMYPSHYSRNSLGHENPAEIPGAIVENGMQKGLPTFKDQRAKVRPWLQAFDIGAVYSDGPKIREQIDAVEKYSDVGWLLWNAANRYTTAGLKLE